MWVGDEKEVYDFLAAGAIFGAVEIPIQIRRS
jgi:hypothetical protein